MKNGKPIFEEERLLLKLFTGIDIFEHPTTE